MKKNQINTPYLNFSRKLWSNLFNSIPIKLTKNTIKKIKKINKDLSINEIKKIYFPLSKLLNYYINNNIIKKNIFKIKKQKIPFVISIAGSVAVGKSTTASILKVLLESWQEHKKVELISTDSFLHSNKILKKKGLMKKKGFPQSYNINYLVKFLSEVKSGINKIKIPIYSHLTYDIIPDSENIINKPDILIIEGLNVLQALIFDCFYNNQHILISDFVDFSLYVDASEKLLQSWFIDRFLKFRKNNSFKCNSYFNQYAFFSEKKATSIALNLWKEINVLNLKKYILPTKERANLIIVKKKNHVVKLIKIRQ